jgi:3-deoxy-D-arabino-heptulosonate 7-phosphate (DAHP) synthase
VTHFIVTITDFTNKLLGNPNALSVVGGICAIAAENEVTISTVTIARNLKHAAHAASIAKGLSRKPLTNPLHVVGR